MKPLLSFIAASLILITLTGVAVHTISTPNTGTGQTPMPDDTDIKLNRPEYDSPVWVQTTGNHTNLSPAGYKAACFVNESGEQTCTYKASYYDDATGQRVFVYVD